MKERKGERKKEREKEGRRDNKTRKGFVINLSKTHTLELDISDNKTTFLISIFMHERHLKSKIVTLDNQTKDYI